MFAEFFRGKSKSANHDVLHVHTSIIGKRLGHYQIIGELGAGGEGVAYVAEDDQLKRLVAIKVLRTTAFTSARARRRFRREAQCAAALNHPNVITIHDVAEDQGVLFIVMEYVPGKTLAEVLRAGRLPLSTCLDYSEQIVDAFSAAHSAGIIHRDITPFNILVSSRGLIKILDFGLAKSITDKTSHVTSAGTVVGTYGYMSPEHVRGGQADPRSDIFSFGILFYEMAVGYPPFRRDSAAETSVAILKEAPADPPPDLPWALLDVAYRCLEKDPEDRFQTMRDIAQALHAIRSTLRSSWL